MEGREKKSIEAYYNYEAIPSLISFTTLTLISYFNFLIVC